MEQENSMVLTKSSLQHLSETRKWARFLAIVGFVLLGLTALIVPFVGLISGMAGHAGIGFFTVIPALFILVLYFFPIYYLYKFSSYAKIAEQQMDALAYEMAFKYLKKHYRFIGILLLVVLVLYVIIGLVAALGLALT